MTANSSPAARAAKHAVMAETASTRAKSCWSARRPKRSAATPAAATPASSQPVARAASAEPVVITAAAPVRARAATRFAGRHRSVV